MIDNHELIQVLRHCDRPESHAKLMDDAADLIQKLDAANKRYLSIMIPALEACRIINEAVAEGHEQIGELVLHLLSAAEPAANAHRAKQEEPK